MGYYSEVALCLDQKGKHALDESLAKISPEIRKEMSDFMGNSEDHLVHSQTSSELWYWDMVKWYYDCPEITFLENFLNSLDIDDYLFIRIGESSDDCEILGCYLDNPFGLYLSRTINFS